MLIYLIVGLIFGVIGALVAKGKNKSAALWFIICFLFPVIGLIILALSGRQEPVQVRVHDQPKLTERYDAKKWNTLVEVDPDIAAAANQLRICGEKYVDLLAEKYLALNDKTYLPNIVSNITSTALLEQEKLAEEAAKEAAKPKIVDEGKFKGRRWRAYNNGRVEGEMLNGNYKEFAGLQEFKDYIS